MQALINGCLINIPLSCVLTNIMCNCNNITYQCSVICHTTCWCVHCVKSKSRVTLSKMKTCSWNTSVKIPVFYHSSNNIKLSKKWTNIGLMYSCCTLTAGKGYRTCVVFMLATKLDSIKLTISEHRTVIETITANAAFIVLLSILVPWYRINSAHLLYLYSNSNMATMQGQFFLSH